MKIHLENNFITEKDAKTIINFLDSSDNDYGKMVHTRRTIRFGIDKYNGTTEKLSSAQSLTEMLEFYSNKATDLVNKVFEHQNPLYVSTLWLSKQTIGSKIMPHSDLDGGINSQYTHSGIIYLNTQTSGGELYFPKLEKEFKPNLGDFILFEARSKESLHGVKLTEQNRYAIPIWFTDEEQYKLT